MAAIMRRLRKNAMRYELEQAGVKGVRGTHYRGLAEKCARTFRAKAPTMRERMRAFVRAITAS